MHAEHPSIHHSSQTQVVEDITAIPPYIYAPVLPLALVVKSVHLCDLARFVIASDERYSIRISNFEQ